MNAFLWEDTNWHTFQCQRITGQRHSTMMNSLGTACPSDTPTGTYVHYFVNHVHSEHRITHEHKNGLTVCPP